MSGNQPELPAEYLTGWWRPGSSEQLSLVCADMPDRPVRKRSVHGRVTASPCDARCTGATGDNCECSCGGANHGIDVYGLPR